MSTPYEDIFDSFRDKIRSFSFVNFDKDDLDEILTGYLKSSIVRFKTCKKDLSDRDDLYKIFNEDLTDEEIEILATLMVERFLDPFIQTEEILREKLSSKDYNLYSPSNFLKELREVRKEAKTEAQRLMTGYSYNDLEDFLRG